LCFHGIDFYPNDFYPNRIIGHALQLSAADLGIPFRDAMLFSTENSITDQKPTILVGKCAGVSMGPPPLKGWGRAVVVGPCQA
jgi:hypothetical protein